MEELFLYLKKLTVCILYDIFLISDLEYEETCEGSIIMQLAPKSSKSLQKLKNSCHTGAIKDFVPEVYRNNVSDLEEGEYLLIFKIFLLPTPPYSKSMQIFL
jgi:hypothetical protein